MDPVDPHELRHVIAANVRRFAKERGLSLNQVADFAGISRSTLYKALGGEHAMTTDRLCKIANVLEVPPAELLQLEPRTASS